MKKLLIAMLVGLLLIGAASADRHNNQDKDKKGIASSCANALAAGTAYVDKCVVAGSSDALTIETQSYTGTWQIDDAKVDPISASLSVGFATSAIDGDIKAGKYCGVVEADMSATSGHCIQLCQRLGYCNRHNKYIQHCQQLHHRE
jgi:hypothetical protein